ncbi:MAG: cytochrome c3 family protein [Opitutaceae bacterium]
MKSRPHRTRNALLVASLAGCGILLVSCISGERTIVAPPAIAGAHYVGSQACVQCHAATVHSFLTATHAKLIARGSNDLNIGCESCHGPGSAHVDSYGAPHTIVNPRNSPEVCFQCHLDKRGEFSLPHSHPVLAGKVSCVDCHDPHRGDVVLGRSASSLASANDTCLRCHILQRGPFVFDHPAVREGCTTCHNPHGTTNDKMLIARNATLCLQCHYQAQTASGRILIGNVDHSSYLNRGTCWSAGCHEAIHGSNVDAHLRY